MSIVIIIVVLIAVSLCYSRIKMGKYEWDYMMEPFKKELSRPIFKIIFVVILIIIIAKVIF